MYLVGDIGGTKALLALFDRKRGCFLKKERLASRSFTSIGDLLDAFFGLDKVEIEGVALACAGPLSPEGVELTNLSWSVERGALERYFPGKKIVLLNDVEAAALALPQLAPKDRETLQAGKPVPHGAIGLLSLGTGLGQAALVWDGKRYVALATEGGHADFGATNEAEYQLLCFLKERFGHVSYERVLSGDGLVAIAQSLQEREPQPIPTGEEAAAEITRQAMEGSSSLCVAAMELYLTILARAAGDMALRYMTTGGLFLGGGISPKLLPKVRDPRFLATFQDKGRFASFLEKIPFHMVSDTEVALSSCCLSCI